jgi:uncharacterized protein YceK
MRGGAVAGCLAALLALGLAGCGTFVNLHEDAVLLQPEWGTRRAYGGVRWSANEGERMLRIALPEASEVEWHYLFWGASALLVDLPLSAVGDTLTLPYVLCVPSGRPGPPPVRECLPVASQESPPRTPTAPGLTSATSSAIRPATPTVPGSGSAGKQ